MIQSLVARMKFPSKSAAYGERHRGHICSKNDLIGFATKEVGHGVTRRGNNRIGATTRRETPMGIRIGPSQIVGHCVDHALWYLSTPRAI